MTGFSEAVDDQPDTDNVEFLHADESTAQEQNAESVAGLKDHLKTMVPEPYQGIVDEIAVHGPKLVSRMQPLNAGLAVSALGLVVCGVGKYIEHQNK
jgi:hypothetical protein